jgi:GNAT superfamily N-acetyltransferase
MIMPSCQIREATVEDFPRMESCAREFFSQSRFLKGFDPGVFASTWAGLLASGAGAIFLLEDENEIHGALGGVAYPDPHTGDLLATEFFWFVSAGHRGQGLRLLKTFETWARAKGCRQIRMAHLVDLMPEKLEAVYKRLGYAPAEVLYVKELPI